MLFEYTLKMVEGIYIILAVVFIQMPCLKVDLWHFVSFVKKKKVQKCAIDQHFSPVKQNDAQTQVNVNQFFTFLASFNQSKSVDRKSVV